MKLLGGKKKILPLKKLHCISSAGWKCFVAEYFLQNMRIAKLTSPDAALESGLSASHIQRDTFLTAMCSSQCGHPGKTGLIFLRFLHIGWEKTLEKQTHISLTAQLQETCMDFWGWRIHYLVRDPSGLGKRSCTQGKVWAARRIWCPGGVANRLSKRFLSYIKFV